MAFDIGAASSFLKGFLNEQKRIKAEKDINAKMKDMQNYEVSTQYDPISGQTQYSVKPRQQVPQGARVLGGNTQGGVSWAMPEQPTAWDIQREARTTINAMLQNNMQLQMEYRKDPSVYQRLIDNEVDRLTQKYVGGGAMGGQMGGQGMPKRGTPVPGLSDSANLPPPAVSPQQVPGIAPQPQVQSNGLQSILNTGWKMSPFGLANIAPALMSKKPSVTQSPTQTKIMMMSPDGLTIGMVPADQAEAAIKSGYKKI